ncbi:MAG TPA: formate dehydrogenase subunit gamma [Burkholderiaceae bacterium]|nr:formate dehydrogenase subunit gamma [Burkholderiaceae bacterium]
MLRSSLVKIILASSFVSCFAGLAVAQQATAPAAAVNAAPAVAGVQSANIFEVKPDASLDANYAKQTNGERAKVQPGNNAPMWRQVGSGAEGYSSLPKATAPEAGVLIQPFTQYPGSRLTTAGEAWRQVRNNWIIPYGGALLLIVLGAIGLFYWRRGTIELNESLTGRKIERFTPFERSAHLANAIAFTILAVSGLVMAFGQYFLMPLMGSSLFGYLTFLLKNAHNFAGPLFAISLLVVIFTYVRDNLPAKGDLNWFLKGGGLLSKQHVKAGRFNAGEKLLFWLGVFAFGLIVVASGLVLDKLVPGLNYERSTMQIAHMVHAVATIAMMGLFMGHIYLGTIGTEGTLQGMQTGYVDEAWAKEHHELWLEDVKSGKVSADRTADKHAARIAAAKVVKA